MHYDPRIHHRHAMRLKGYDYSQVGCYFVNICTKSGMTIFGSIENAEIRLSPLGRIVEKCWKEIPAHYPSVRLESFQIMPNHIHAIIEIIKDQRIVKLSGDGAFPVPAKSGSGRPNTLGDIVGSFKSAATRAIHQAGHFVGRSVWQSRFYDHIIRDDVSYFFIQRYIELNPIFWEYSRWNRKGKTISLGEFEDLLREKFDIAGEAAAIILGSERMFELRTR